MSIFAGWWSEPSRDPEAILDTAIRRAVRGVVAGAAPRADAWERLHARIQRPPGTVVRFGGAQVTPWGQPWMLAALAMPQLGRPGLSFLAH